MFKNIIYCTCCLSALLSGATMIENVVGMDGIVDTNGTVRITEKQQFLNISPNEAKIFRFENQKIDLDFHLHFCRFSPDSIDSVSFNNCSFDEECFDFLNGYAISTLEVTNCNLTTEQAAEILSNVYPYSIRKINFSNNKLGISSDFSQVLRDRVHYKMSLDILDIKENEFCNDAAKQIISDNERFKSIVKIVF